PVPHGHKSGREYSELERGGGAESAGRSSNVEEVRYVWRVTVLTLPLLTYLLHNISMGFLRTFHHSKDIIFKFHKSSRITCVFVFVSGTCGTSSPYMRPVYPSKTFPNLYSLATGLYPESHGIVGNTMHDPVFNATFTLRGREKLNHRWWGELLLLLILLLLLLLLLLYVSLSVCSALFRVIPLERRILTILNWLHLPDNVRPYVYAVHSEQPDTFGHRLGPLSSELDNPLREIDNVIGQLMNGLKQMNLHRCVNVIIVGDHGMEEAHCDRTEFLISYPLNIDEINLIPGSLGRIRPRDPKSPTCTALLLLLLMLCKMPTQHFKPYLKQHLPKRLHYANNRRIEDVHLLMERKTRCLFNGDHGFDNKINSMRTIFIGHGPSFKFRKMVPEFENIELYNVMCDLLDLSPAPNNGTYGSLNDMLRNPPFSPVQPEEVTSPTPPLDPYAIDSYDLGCSCDDEVWQFNTSHLPFGRPAVLFHTHYSLLHHMEFISGYSRELALPLWGDMSLSDPPSSHTCLRADPRVSPIHSQSCSIYHQHQQLSYGFLFPPGTSRVWGYLQGVLFRRYAEENNGVNILVGPVFDHNHDGLRDTVEPMSRTYTSEAPPLPSHMFTVVSSCAEFNTTVDECEEQIELLSFILPIREDNTEACNSGEPESQWVEDILQMHTARVRDIEILTGLDLFRSTNLTQVQVLKLKTHMHTFELDD
uniref:ENPP1-3/EXOG-like endonuclease/phosphodiesterase domain-containing protein n=1 Tax=Periophthalmus magnuspinnatus TaxID=409849 RepID=A0A3B4AHA2_9GOBI